MHALLDFLTLLLLNQSLVFKAHDFKTCLQSGFCRRVSEIFEADGALAADEAQVVTKNLMLSRMVDAFWEETFSSWTDSKPKGEAKFQVVLLYIYHVCCRPRITVYGIPQHATNLALPLRRPGAMINDRTYTDPYQLYNNDVFKIFHGLQSLCTALYH